MFHQAHTVVPLGGQPAAAFLQLAALFIMALALVLFSAMFMVDGLYFQRVRFRYGVVILGVARGGFARVIGVACIAVELLGMALVVVYVDLLRRYCGASTGCYFATPLAGVLANWVTGLSTAAILFCAGAWVRNRLKELRAPTRASKRQTTSADARATEFALPGVLRYVNGKLGLAREHALSRREVGEIMDFVEQHAPFIVLSGREQVMDGSRIDPQRLAHVFIADQRFRDRGQQYRVAVEAVTEAYVSSHQK